MPKASTVRGRSRLTHPHPNTSALTAPLSIKPIIRNRYRWPTLGIAYGQIIGWFQHRLPYVGLTIVSVIIGILLITTVSPSKVANVGFPETYLPLLVIIGFFAFSASRLFLNHRHASYIALLSVVVVFVQLHNVSFPAAYWLLPVGILVCGEVIALLAKRR